MTTTAAKAVEARQKQSDASKFATFDMLKHKRRAVEDFSIFIDDGEEKKEVQLRFRSIGAVAYDKLVGKYPPTPDQRAEGASFNIDTFAPALIAACAEEPEMSYTEAKMIWDSDEWSRGEVFTLYRRAVDLCNRGLDIPFSENGSE